MKSIKYRKGYKYQLADRYITNTAIKPRAEIDTEFINLSINGQLTIAKGYAWDGPSGPTYDSLNSMRGSLAHDAKYQLIRLGHLSYIYKGDADSELVADCMADGMWRWRARLWGWAVRRFGNVNPSSSPRVYFAPWFCGVFWVTGSVLCHICKNKSHICKYDSKIALFADIMRRCKITFCVLSRYHWSVVFLCVDVLSWYGLCYIYKHEDDIK